MPKINSYAYRVELMSKCGEQTWNRKLMHEAVNLQPCMIEKWVVEWFDENTTFTTRTKKDYVKVITKMLLDKYMEKN
jgi:hypothetical protein